MKKTLLILFSTVSLGLFGQNIDYEFLTNGGALDDVNNWGEVGNNSNHPVSFALTTDTWDMNGLNGILNNSLSIAGTFLNSSVTTSTLTLSANLDFQGDVQNGDKFTGSYTSVNYYYTTNSVDILPGTYSSALALQTGVSGVAQGNITVSLDLELFSGSELDMQTFTLATNRSNLIGGAVNGTIKTQNTTASPISLSSGSWMSAIEFNAPGNQTVPSGEYEGGLTLSTAGTKTASGDITVHTSLDVDAVFDMSTHQLLDGSAAFTVSGTSAIRTQSTDNPPIPSSKTWGTVIFNASSGGPQYIPGGTYDNIGDASNVATVSHEALGNITINDAWLDVGTDIDMGTFQVLTDGDGFSATSIGTYTISTQNTSSNPIPDNISWGNGCTINFNSSVADQTIPPGTYYNLQCESSSSGTPRHKTTSGAITVNNGLIILGSDSYLVLNHVLTDGGTFGTSSTGTYGTLEIGSSSPAGAFPSNKTWYCGVFIDQASYSIPALTLVDNDLTIGESCSLGGNVTFSGAGDLELGTGSAVTLDCGSNTIDFGSGGASVLATFGSGSVVRTSATTPFSGTILFGSGVTPSFYGNNSQVIPAGTYRRGVTLEASTGTKTLSGNIALDGTTTINTNTVLACSTFQVTEDDVNNIDFIIAGSGSFTTDNTSTTPFPADKDWSSLSEVTYRSSSTSLVGGTYSSISITGSARTLTTQGNVNMSSILFVSTSNAIEIDIAKNTYINCEGVTNTTGVTVVNLKADSDGYGQLKCRSVSNSGTSLDFTKEQYVDLSTARYFHMGLPLTGSSLDELNNSSIMVGNGGSAAQVTTWYWDASTSSWTAADISASTTNTLASRGQAIFAGTTGDGTFLRSGSGIIDASGDAVADNITYSLDYHDGQTSNNGQGGSVSFVGGSGVSATQGWNFVSNPYLGNYDWQDQTLPSNISSAIYQWDGSQWFSYNTGSQTGDSDARYISPGKGFWIQATAAPGNLALDTSNIDVTGSSSFWKAPADGVTLTFTETNSMKSDNSYVNFIANSTPGFDPGLDALKLVNSDNIPSNWIEMNSSEHLSICSSPVSVTSFPVSFSDSDNNEMITVSLDYANLKSFTTVEIEDIKTGNRVELTNNGSYSFVNDIGYPEQRFILHFSGSTVNLEDEAEAQNSVANFDAYFSNESFGVFVGEELMYKNLTVSISDLTGKMLQSYTFSVSESNPILLHAPSIPSGVYVITFTQEGEFLQAIKSIKP
ncbi:beta strand repeat-containing protein [Phaeocystidibacter luteus]|uniref:Uncharacterized protein n=1 Tax=Phaeocystidibacter luteus TaxID=911197 RepID=A0A6N6RFD0_9FLAO|nr:hypothetical protein [Phaeocystidibacter luteus]KAB2807029.1 hypothetical protein F8C67_12595 [Phaeocystidibacter luteus]